MKMALIMGVTGQVGAYLAEFPLEKSYEAHGIKRRSSLLSTDHIGHLYQDLYARDRKLALHYGEAPDSLSLIRTKSGSYFGSGHDCSIASCCQKIAPFRECGGKSA